ncbi:MAG: hypothetical protein ONB23_06760 [candidate division KSB1 bacterium]|nr:hypothetical protein [candidate division KSB1 bacterium]
MLNFDWSAAVPLGWVKIIVMALFALVVVWVWSLPSSYLYRGAPDRRAWRNLKLWATFVVAFQAFLYWVFG